MRQSLAVAILFAALAANPVALLAQTDTSPAGASVATNKTALSIYEEGKKLYDAGDYTAARRKFLEAARQDPENPRWHYNIGLTHRQLDNPQAARQSFLKARSLDPNYKQKEIDEKLREMGFDADAQNGTRARSRNSSSPAETFSARDKLAEAEDAPVDVEENHTGLIIFFVMAALMVGMVIFVVRRVLRAAKSGAKSPAVQIDQQGIATAHGQLQAVSEQLVPIEHAMRLGEHADLRSLLEHATLLEASARQGLEMARQGNASALRMARQQIAEASSNAGQATELATRLYGDQAFAGQGERIGCFFCARPLANPAVRQPVSMKRGADIDTVISCPDCAAQAARGEAPRIRTGSDQQAHWSDEPGFDPYRARHADGPVRRVPAQDFRPAQPVSQLAQQAGGAAMLGVGALVGAGVAMAASHFLDLDAAKAAEQTQKAAGEAANRVRERSSSSRDHS